MSTATGRVRGTIIDASCPSVNEGNPGTGASPRPRVPLLQVATDLLLGTLVDFTSEEHAHILIVVHG